MKLIFTVTLMNVPLTLFPSVIEAVSLQGRKEETSLVSTGPYVIGNTSLDFQRGMDRQTLRTHGPLNADYIIKVRQRRDNMHSLRSFSI